MNTPKPQEGIWTLTAPDGRTWQGDTPIRCVAAESRERIPAEVALQRIFDATSEDHDWLPIDSAPKDGTRVILSWGGKSINGFYLDNSHTSHPWAGWRVESLVVQPAGKPTHWQPFPTPYDVPACRAEPRGPAEWVCDCKQMRPDCKPNVDVQASPPTLLSYEEIECIVDEVLTKYPDRNQRQIAHYAADRAQRAVLQRNAGVTAVGLRLTDEQVSAEWMRWNLPGNDAALAFHEMPIFDQVKRAFQDGLRRGAALGVAGSEHQVKE